MVPVLWVSKYAYPWADDFGYGAEAHLALVKGGSVLGAMVGAFKTMWQTYLEWQGTYTSCFLMAIHPGVFSVKLYHLTGAIMLTAMLVSTFWLVYLALGKVFHASKAVVGCVALLTFLLSVEGVDGYAEAFTWYNSAVHYTFGHAMLIIFMGLTFYELNTPKDSGRRELFKRD